MTYDISIEMTSQLSSAVVKDIVAKSIEEHTAMAVERVEETYDDGVFTGFLIHFKSKSGVASGKSWRPQIWR